MIGIIHIGVWAGSSSTIRIFGTQSADSSNYQHDRKRRSTREDKTINGDGREHYFGRISQRGTKIKGQSMA